MEDVPATSLCQNCSRFIGARRTGQGRSAYLCEHCIHRSAKVGLIRRLVVSALAPALLWIAISSAPLGRAIRGLPGNLGDLDTTTLIMVIGALAWFVGWTLNLLVTLGFMANILPWTPNDDLRQGAINRLVVRVLATERTE